MRALGLVVLALALAPALALGQAPPPEAYDAMIHVFDAGFIDAAPNGTLAHADGVIAVMSFRTQNVTPRAHTVTADDRTFDVPLAPPDNADGYTLATFHAPAKAGRYPYHDATAPEHKGLLVVVGTSGASAKPTPALGAAPLALALALVLALAGGRRHG